jgi:hypothetical protein
LSFTAVEMSMIRLRSTFPALHQKEVGKSRTFFDLLDLDDCVSFGGKA